jgi:hypothetical protein
LFRKCDGLIWLNLAKIWFNLAKFGCAPSRYAMDAKKTRIIISTSKIEPKKAKVSYPFCFT